ncbi:MAG: AAA family ATPase [Dehalococcoidia bacterium]|nr:AAA family ATPase [Dehalococcoidia bacterium]
MEEHFLEAIDEEEEDEDGEEFEVPGAYSRFARRHKMLARRNKTVVDRFLGEGNRANAVVILPRYYGELLTWALQRYIEKEGWEDIRALGYHGREPVYIDVSTDCDTCENLLMDGQLLLERGDKHFIVTVDINMQIRNSVRVEGPAGEREELEKFVNEVGNIALEQNFYRGKKFEFAGRIRFLNIKDKSWDSIILDPAIKREVKANTINFLNRRKRWAEYRIPQKRGVLLAGEPGTGKTLICKALMAEAAGVTCITTSAYALSDDEYITELYEMAQDLSPCIVFIEDIDLIGLNREEYHYQHGPALLSLLSVLDGVEEKQEIVTVATTNNLETLDRAISQRPSRFDRVVKLSLPSLEERRELIDLLCRKIPIDESGRDYIAHKAECCTPAQLQEIIYSLAIEYPDESPDALPTRLELSKDNIDGAISRINGRNGHHLGFNISGNHNSGKTRYIGALE